jgi:hypothetical protein
MKKILFLLGGALAIITTQAQVFKSSEPLYIHFLLWPATLLQAIWPWAYKAIGLV